MLRRVAKFGRRHGICRAARAEKRLSQGEQLLYMQKNRLGHRGAVDEERDP